MSRPMALRTDCGFLKLPVNSGTLNYEVQGFWPLDAFLWPSTLYRSDFSVCQTSEPMNVEPLNQQADT